MARRGASSGYKGSFAPPPALSDDALRARSAGNAAATNTRGGAALDPDAHDPSGASPLASGPPRAADAHAVDAPQAALEGPPTFGPLVPDLNKTIGQSRDATPNSNGDGDGVGGTGQSDTALEAWPTGDRRRLGGFDARFHSTRACAACWPVWSQSSKSYSC
jgi:hypothetical protein